MFSSESLIIKSAKQEYNSLGFSKQKKWKRNEYYFVRLAL